MATELESDNGDAGHTEQHALMDTWQQTQREYLRHSCLHQHFETQVARTPEALAIAFEDGQLTYRELDRRANQLAHTLQQRGVGPEVVVSVYMERSLEFVIALLGILKAGGAYIPLDPSYPSERIAIILQETQAPVLLTQEHLTPAISAYVGVVLYLDSDWAAMSRQGLDPPGSTVVSDNTAYIIYTSGSTGQPKGVQVSHASLLNLVFWHQEMYKLGVADRMSQMASLAFDACVWEIWSTMLAGVCLHLPHERVRLSLSALQHWLIEQQITLCFLPTPLAEAFLTLPWKDENCVRTLFVGGDKLRRVPAQALPCTLIDCYGPAESTVIAIVSEVPTGPRTAASAATCRPVANTSIYLLNSSLQPLPLGEVGEIYIGGAGLARGYLRRPDLTAERFLPCPFGAEPGTRLYRTGDLARYRANGTIEYLGRSDHQVKIRGFRIELEDIEGTLCTHPQVREAVIVAHADAEDKQLVAYVVPKAEQATTIGELRRFVQERLPNYMVPAAFILLEAFPLTLHGKLDRAALPPPLWEDRERQTVYSPPRTPTERLLAQLWAEVLPVKQVGREDTFFLLGGHSLLAMHMLLRLQARLHREIPLGALFETPILADLARYLDEFEPVAANSLQQDSPPLRACERENSPAGEMYAPLSFAQQNLWLHDQLEPGNPSYTILTALRFHGPLNILALERSVNALIRRHESLRTTFHTKHTQPVQVIAPLLQISLPVIDISGLEGEDDEGERQSRLETAHAFDLAHGPLLRVTLLRLGQTEHVLLVNMHHIISDGWSVSILVEELGRLYAASLSSEITDPTTILPALPVHYADYAIWQRGWLQDAQHPYKQQIDYWRQQLAGVPAFLELPTDYPRPTVQTYRGASVALLLDASLVSGLHTINQKRTEEVDRGGYTLFMLLLAVFQLLLFRLTGEADMVVGTPFANRNRSELEGLIGFFMNTLVLRVDLSGDPSFLELLRRVRRCCLDAYTHQDVPFSRLLEEVRPERTLSHTPLFQVFFNLLNYPTHPLEWSGLQGEVFWPQQVGAKFDLTLYAQEVAQGIRLEAVYNADLFASARVQEMLEEMKQLLTQVVAHPEKQLSHFSLVTPTSTVLLPDPTEPLSSAWEGSVPDLFAIQAQRIPGKLAVRDEESEWSYRELDERSNQLAHYLCTHGIQSQDVVAIYAARSASLACAILGVLKAGAAYLILDPAYPVSRLITYLQLAHIKGFIHLDAAGPLPPAVHAAVIAQTSHCQLTLAHQPTTYEHDALHDYPITSPGRMICQHDSACVAFTAGSTGQPKGVLQEHGSLTHFLPWLQETFDLTEHDRYSMLSGLAHDPLQRDIFTPLCLGATLSVPSQEHIHTPGWLAAWMRRESITITNLTPAMLHVLTYIPSSQQGDQAIDSLRYAFIVGDLLTRSDVNKLQRIAPALTSVNLYGTTETQRAMGYYSVPHRKDAVPGQNTATYPMQEGKEQIPLGRGWKDTQLLILHRSGVLAGIGEVGEICIRSPHLARGYLDNEALTRERFIVNPFTQKIDDRLYRTGDLGRYLPNGAVEYSGRNDQQVKVRGFRIELGEIETALHQHPAIREVVVIVREDSPGEKRLVAYVVPFPEYGAWAGLPGELRQFLATRLPSYMLPAAFVVLEALPLLPTHKIHREALPLPVLSHAESASSSPGCAASSSPGCAVQRGSPRNPKEEILLGLWKQVLQVEQVGRDENFFELGGHSLLATQLLSTILDTFHVVLPLRTLFEAPTVASFAAILEQHSRSDNVRKQPALVPLARRSRRSDGLFHPLQGKKAPSEIGNEGR